MRTHERARALVEDAFGIGLEVARKKLETDPITHAMNDGTLQVVASLIGEVDRLKMALGDIQLAAFRGKICDDVAWFDKHETLFDFIDGVLDPKADKALRDLFLEEPTIPSGASNWYEVAAYYRQQMAAARAERDRLAKAGRQFSETMEQLSNEIEAALRDIDSAESITPGPDDEPGQPSPDRYSVTYLGGCGTISTSDDPRYSFGSPEMRPTPITPIAPGTINTGPEIPGEDREVEI